MAGANATPSSPFNHLRSPRFIENGDPLSDDGRLLYGPLISNEEEPQSPEVLKKSPSDQALSPFRWGSSHRKTGRSKTGLSITVPCPSVVGELQKQAQDSASVPGPIFRDKSILYTYSSSSSGGNKTGSSFGAIGDHTNPNSARLNSPADMRIPGHSTRPRLEGADQPDKAGEESTLQQLVENSQPDLQMYDILIIGETGPLSQPRRARIVNASEFSPVLHRRRSLNDLVERLSTGNLPPDLEHVSDATDNQPSKSVSPRNQGNSAHSIVPLEPVRMPEIWRRRGPSFRQLALLALNQLGTGTATDGELDPSTFSLPYGVSGPSLKGNLTRAYESSHWYT